MTSSERINADIDAGVPTRLILRGSSRETVVDFAALAEQRARTMLWPMVVSTMAEDYGVTASRDATGRITAA